MMFYEASSLVHGFFDIFYLILVLLFYWQKIFIVFKY